MPIVAVVGATGTGKSEFALDLAEAVATAGGRAEIVNADAMQLYRGMDVGTAKLAPAERRGVPHHLLDVLDVVDEASVAAYQRDARTVAAALDDRGDLAILVGGSGLYVSSVLHDLRFPGTDPVIRARLEREADELGPGALHARLRAIDPEAAASVDPQNPRRIVRALEVIELTGEPKAARLPERPVAWRPHRIVHLRSDRAALVDRLDRRAERIWQGGLLDEVRRLIPLGLERGVTASKAIGYAQALDTVHGRVPEAEALERMQQLTRTYARRQVGWFRRYDEAVEVDADDPAARAAALAETVHAVALD